MCVISPVVCIQMSLEAALSLADHWFFFLGLPWFGELVLGSGVSWHAWLWLGKVSLGLLNWRVPGLDWTLKALQEEPLLQSPPTPSLACLEKWSKAFPFA